MTGCGTIHIATTPEQDPWVGRTSQQLLVTYGPPNGGVMNDGQGGSVFTYSNSNTLTLQPASGNSTPPPRLTIVATKSYYVNAEGVIYATRQQEGPVNQ